jgi:hypothetical protein
MRYQTGIGTRVFLKLNGVKGLLLMSLWIHWEVPKEPNPSHVRWKGMALGRKFVWDWILGKGLNLIWFDHVKVT